MQRIIDELRQLLSKRLHIAVFDDRRSIAKIRAKHEGVSGGRVDAVRSPRAALRRIALDVVGGVMGYSDDELAVLPRNPLEELPLQKLNINDSEGAAILLRSKNVAVANGNSDRYRLHLRLAQKRMPALSIRKGSAQQRVGVLCIVPG